MISWRWKLLWYTHCLFFSAISSVNILWYFSICSLAFSALVKCRSLRATSRSTLFKVKSSRARSSYYKNVIINIIIWKWSVQSGETLLKCEVTTLRSKTVYSLFTFNASNLGRKCMSHDSRAWYIPLPQSWAGLENVVRLMTY